jgi:23S rRNA pseudouridine1911/1915/1917 synthase
LQLVPIIFSAEDLRPHAGQRLDVFLAEALGRSRSHAQRLLREGRANLQPHPQKAEPSYRLREGDSLTLQPASEIAAEALPAGEAIPLSVLYEDEALLALNKQPGLVVHPAAGHRTGTLVNALIHYHGDRLARRGGEERLGIVHRLDKETSGVLLVAKTDLAHEKLAAAFAARQVKKYYRALCWGVFRRSSGDCRGALGRHPVQRKKFAVLKTGGRPAHTEYRVLAQGPYGAEVECLLHTGRTHQIRVHLAHLGHPIWGDVVYGRPHKLADGFAPARHMLHAARLEIAHPLTGEPLKFEATLPADFAESRARLLEKKT